MDHRTVVPAWTTRDTIAAYVTGLGAKWAALTRTRAYRITTGSLVAAMVLGVVSFVEIRTSWLQSVLFSMVASRLSYTVEPGPSHDLVPPGRGPVDDSRGYAEVVDLQRRLLASGFRVVEQSRFSLGLVTSTRLGISPPQPEPSVAGLVIHDDGGRVLYDAIATQHRFENYEAVPPLVARSLLYIENRGLDTGVGAFANPAVDWASLGRAAVLSLAHQAGLPATFQGGSTLAVQLEKFRHSDGGRTASPVEKLRQIVSASLAAYHDGPDTRDEQRQIVLDYLNSMPLSASPGFGEVHGLGNGLTAWFGLDPVTTFKDLESPDMETRAEATRSVLALICAVRAPSRYLRDDRLALERRMRFYAGRLAANKILDPVLLKLVLANPLRFADEGPQAVISFDDRKPVNLVRTELLKLLGAENFYDLDRLHVEVETTLDGALQDSVMRLFRNLRDPQFVEENGLVGPRLLEGGDPGRVVYSLRLVEHGSDGEGVLIHADNLDRPFDVNRGMRLELGSTAKLRTMVHYLEIVGLLHAELRALGPDALKRRARDARDPITEWAAMRLAADPGQSLNTLLEAALERRYSANPGELFFTGGGQHVFHNFDSLDDGAIMTLREASVRSTNLVFIRLMRDVVRYHAARLPYDARQALKRGDDPERLLMLDDIADREALGVLKRAYESYRGLMPRDLPTALLGGEIHSPRKLAALYFAWHPGGSPDSLRAWLVRNGGEAVAVRSHKLASSYGSTTLGLADYGYLVGRHPLEVWVAGKLYRNPRISWTDITTSSGDARQESSEWLFKTRHRHAQDLRLKTRVEEDAFKRMTPYWRRLGFPFERLVASYATSIGSSADRPDALSDLMGIIVNDGVRRTPSLVRRVRLAPGTPYHTVLEATAPREERVLDPAVAQAIRGVLAQVVERGTAHRVFEAFRDSLGNAFVVGGKTGSGDNRVKKYGPGGRLVENRAVSRSAAFTFFIGDRHYGVITASVQGPESKDYQFTSSLPLAILRLLAPALDSRLGNSGMLSGPMAGDKAAVASDKAAVAAGSMRNLGG